LAEVDGALQIGSPVHADSVGESLHWLRNELGLSRDQYRKLESLHREGSPPFTSIFSDLQSQKTQVQNFELMQSYRVTEDYHQLQTQASSATAEWVARVSQVATTEQRQRYLELIQIKLDPTPKPDDANSPRV
jgi:hypothetical protein